MAGIPSLCHLLESSFPRTRESRFVLRPIRLDTRFRGYDGTQVTSSIVGDHRLISNFEGGHEGSEITILTFVSFVVNGPLSNLAYSAVNYP